MGCCTTDGMSEIIRCKSKSITQSLNDKCVMATYTGIVPGGTFRLQFVGQRVMCCEAGAMSYACMHTSQIQVYTTDKGYPNACGLYL